jgi:aspartyl protease family protein
MEFQKESYPLRGQSVVTVKVEINGVRGLFILDTGATYVAMKSNFADRAKISQVGAGDITMAIANGLAKAKLAKADKVTLGKLAASNVPVAIQSANEKNYGAGVDGLLGMSFLSGSKSRWRTGRSKSGPGEEIIRDISGWNGLNRPAEA